MAHYDSRVQPPAAYTEIYIVNPANGNAITYPAKLDTGATLTVLPRHAVAELGLVADGQVSVRGYDHVQVERPAYFVHLQVEGYSFSEVKVTASPRADVLLGRDVLNHFVVTFDGKNRSVEMKDP